MTGGQSQGQGRAATPRHPAAAWVENALGALIRVALVLSCLCLAAIILIGTIDTTGRLIGRPLTASTEMTEALLAAAIFMALPTVQRQRGHVVVDLLKQSFGARLRHASELISLLIAVFVFYLLARQGLDGGITSARQGEVSAGLLPIPVWIAKCVAAGGLILTALEAARQVVFMLIWRDGLSEPNTSEPTNPETAMAGKGE